MHTPVFSRWLSESTAASAGMSGTQRTHGSVDSVVCEDGLQCWIGITRITLVSHSILTCNHELRV
jgi:hypothetical protein